MGKDVPAPARTGAASTHRRLWRFLVSASPSLGDVADQRRAELLAAFLVVFVPLGLISGLVQVVLVPGFLRTFVLMCATLTVLSIAYTLSRTSRYRVGAAIAVVAPIVTCIVIGVSYPHDRVWYAFMAIGVLVATLFLPVRDSAAVAAATFLSAAAVVVFAPGYDRPAYWVPPLAFHAVFSPLIVVVAAYRTRIEEERSRAQRALEEAHRLETIGRLASGIAHDFNNLIAVIKGNADVIASHDAGRADVGEIQEAAMRATSLVRQLVTYASRRALEPMTVRLEEVVQGLHPLLRRVAGDAVQVVVESQPAVLAVRANVAHLEQVIMNLVVNAREAMPEGGTLTIRTAREELGPSESAELEVAAGSYVVLSVADTGVGMSEEVRARVFEPFFSTRTDKGGTGLGLATVLGVVRQNGGGVAVRSRPGAGATFFAYLPAIADEGGGGAPA